MPESERLIADYWAAAEARDWQAFGETLADDVVYRGPQTGEEVRGREAYLRFNREGFDYDWHISVVLIVAAENRAASWIEFRTAEGTQDGLCFFEIDRSGRIETITDFWPEPYELPESRAHLVGRYRPR